MKFEFRHISVDPWLDQSRELWVLAEKTNEQANINITGNGSLVYDFVATPAEDWVTLFDKESNSVSVKATNLSADWTKLGVVTSSRKGKLIGKKELDALKVVLENMSFECHIEHVAIIASSTIINEQIRVLCDDKNNDYCNQIRFTVWYDPHRKYEERGEKLLRIRIPTPKPNLPEEIKYKICSDVNGDIRVGRFNLDNIIPFVEWAWFVNRDVDRRSILQAMVHLGESFVIAAKTIEVATERLAQRPR